MIRYTLKKRVLITEINQLFNIIRIGLWLQGLQIIETFHHLLYKYNPYKQVNNMFIEI